MRKDVLSVTAYCIFPMLLYFLIFETAALALTAGQQALVQAGAEEIQNAIVFHRAEVTALITALSMAAGFLAVSGTAGREVTFFRSVSSDREETAVFAIGALALALLLNLLLSGSGLAGAGENGGAAAEQATSVSLLPGLLVYGILSPAIEETVFRGITYARIRRVVLAGKVRDDDKAAGRTREGGKNGSLPYLKPGAMPAMIVSSFLFGIYHGNPAQGIYAFCMGCVFCLFLELTESMAAVAGLHGLINSAVLLLSRQETPGLDSPAWLAGMAGIVICCGGYLAWRHR